MKNLRSCRQNRGAIKLFTFVFYEKSGARLLEKVRLFIIFGNPPNAVKCNDIRNWVSVLRLGAGCEEDVLYIDDGSCTCTSGIWGSKCYFPCDTGCESSMWKVKVIDLVTTCIFSVAQFYKHLCVFLNK